MVHDDGDTEELEEYEAIEAIRAFSENLYEETYHDLIKDYVGAGVRLYDPITGVETIEREALPDGMSVDEYFDHRDLYVANFYGHSNRWDHHASRHANHHTTSCREQMVTVLRKSDDPWKALRAEKFAGMTYARTQGWPDVHPQHTTISRSGKVYGGYVCSRAVLLAALKWPKSYQFIEAREEWGDQHEDSWHRVVVQNQGVVTHILGEAVMPALATAIMRCAAKAAPTEISALVDLFCCGGGFSLGAVDALRDSLRYVDGVDTDRLVLRNYNHNMRRALQPDGTVNWHLTKAPSTFPELCNLISPETCLFPRTLGPGTHLHMSPPCQKFVNGTGASGTIAELRKRLAPWFSLMVEAKRAGCTCSLEEHIRCVEIALTWLEGRPADERHELHVYKVTARDDGSPTNRERCIVTSFPLDWEEDRNPANSAGRVVPDAPVGDDAPLGGDDSAAQSIV